MLDVSADSQELHVVVRSQIDIADHVGGLGDGGADSAGGRGIVGGGDGEAYIVGELSHVNLAEQLGGLDQAIPDGVHGQLRDDSAGAGQSSALFLVQVAADELLDPCVAIFDRINSEHSFSLLYSVESLCGFALATGNGGADLSAAGFFGLALFKFVPDRSGLRFQRVQVSFGGFQLRGNGGFPLLELFNGHVLEFHQETSSISRIFCFCCSLFSASSRSARSASITPLK